MHPAGCYWKITIFCWTDATPLHVKQLLTNSMSLWQVQRVVYPQMNSLLQKKTDIVSYPMASYVYNMHLTVSGRSVAMPSEADTSFFVSPITWDTNYSGWNEFALWILQEGVLILFSIRTLLTLSLKTTFKTHSVMWNNVQLGKKSKADCFVHLIESRKVAVSEFGVNSDFKLTLNRMICCFLSPFSVLKIAVSYSTLTLGVNYIV